MSPTNCSVAQKIVADTIESAEEFADAANAPANRMKPRLFIEDSSPERSIAALRDILACDDELFDRGVPVKLIRPSGQNGFMAHVLSPDGLVLKVHMIARPFRVKNKSDGSAFEVDARLPKSHAMMYLDWRGEWNLRPLNGIASVPLLRADGSIFSTEGYDASSGMWLENMPDLTGLVLEHPTLVDAEAALLTVRNTFRTFCFADADTVEDPCMGTQLVDTNKPPGRDESAFLHALLTAVARPSLYLAPGIIIRAAPMSGAGAGKGLLARCICTIAFGHEPHAVTSGGTPEEIEKRIAAELIGGSSALFLDNLNNTSFRSDLLASVLTERPARVRLLGKSQMVDLNTSTFVVLTGNGLSVVEDLARRFLMIELDPRTEDPESRSFAVDVREDVTMRRRELLAALLTIWRWGQRANTLTRGRPLGSYEQWCRWVRNPLLELGCQDPAERVSEVKERDGRRQTIGEFFAVLWEHHQGQAVTASKLHDSVKMVLDPQNRGRQYLAAALEKLTNTRMAGFILTRQRAQGAWGAATYALRRTDPAEGHRDHRGHGNSEKPPVNEPTEASFPPGTSSTRPSPPTLPMPFPTVEDAVEGPKAKWSQKL